MTAADALYADLWAGDAEAGGSWFAEELPDEERLSLPAPEVTRDDAIPF